MACETTVCRGKNGTSQISYPRTNFLQEPPRTYRIAGAKFSRSKFFLRTAIFEEIILQICCTRSTPVQPGYTGPMWKYNIVQQYQYNIVKAELPMQVGLAIVFTIKRLYMGKNLKFKPSYKPPISNILVYRARPILSLAGSWGRGVGKSERMASRCY